MKNKVLIKVVVPELDSEFDLFVPVNEIIWKIKRLLIGSISDLTNIQLDFNKEYILMNKDNSRVYKNNEIVIDTDIRNSTELLIFSR